MSVINFAVTIDPSKKDVALKTMALIAAMAEVNMNDLSVAKIEVYDAKEVSPEKDTKMEVVKEEAPKKKKSRKKAVVADVSGESEIEVEVGEGEDKIEEKPEPKKAKKDDIAEKAGKSNLEVTVEDLRSLLKDVVHENKDAIKEKLTEFGGSSISTLPEDKYAAMYEYMESLK